MINVFLTEFPELGFGYDIKITDENVSLNDYITALDDFQEKYVAACRGCDGCCWERVPLGIVDYYWGAALFNGSYTICDWLKKVAAINDIAGGIDLYLKRGEDSACMFLDKEKKECKDHTARPLVCRTHTCLPKSGVALELRSAIVNMLEDELVRRLLMETQTGAMIKDSNWNEILEKANIEDYASNVLSSFILEDLKDNWRNVKIKDIVSVELWGQLFTINN